MYNTGNDREIQRLLKKAVENIEVPKNLIDKCIAESQKSNAALGNVLTSSAGTNEIHESREEEEKTSRIFTNLSNSLNEIKHNHPKNLQDALKEFSLAVKKESAADIMTCYLSQASDLLMKNELNLSAQEGTWFPSKMGGLVKRRNIPLLLLDKQPQVFEDAGADYLFSDSNFLKREKVKAVVSLPFRINSQRGIVFLSYRKGSTIQPEINKLLVNKVPRWISELLSNKQASPQDKPVREQGMENRDFAELIKKTAIEGLTDDRIGEILKTLSCWLDFRNVFFSWHEIDEENRKICLRYLYCSEEKEKPITYDKIESNLDDNQGIVAEAAQSGTYVLVNDIYEKKWLRKYKNLPIRGTYPEIRSELAVPLNRYDGIHVGVLNLESPKEGKFKEHHARQIEKIGQAIVIAAQTHEMLKITPGSVSQNTTQPTFQPNQNLSKFLNTLFDTLINHKTALVVSEEVQKITDLALNFFNTSAVDIWQYDHENQEFTDEWGLSLSEMFKEKCDEQHLSQADLKEKFRPRRNGNSQLLMKQTDKIIRINDVADSSEKHNASPDTIALGIHSLLGVPIVGPQSTYPDGVMWLRFDKNFDFNHDLIETAQKLAGFVHMLWNPLSYNLPTPRVPVPASNQNYFQINGLVRTKEPYISDEGPWSYPKHSMGKISGWDSDNLVKVDMFDHKDTLALRPQSLESVTQSNS